MALDGETMRCFLTVVVTSAVLMGCADGDLNEPVLHKCIGRAVVSGVVRDFDGVPLGDAQVEFVIKGSGGSEPGSVGQGVTVDDGSFRVELRASDTEGEQTVIGRVLRSTEMSTGEVDFVSDCRAGEAPGMLELDLVATPTAVIPPDLVISLYRLHAWYGPHYSVSVDQTGSVTFESFHDTLVDGVATGQVDLLELARLYRVFEGVGFWTIKELHDIEECDRYTFDIHYASTSLHAGGQTHTVIHDHGCYGIPSLDSMTSLECLIDAVLSTVQWTGQEALPCQTP